MSCKPLYTDIIIGYLLAGELNRLECMNLPFSDIAKYEITISNCLKAQEEVKEIGLSNVITTCDSFDYRNYFDYNALKFVWCGRDSYHLSAKMMGLILNQPGTFKEYKNKLMYYLIDNNYKQIVLKYLDIID